MKMKTFLGVALLTIFVLAIYGACEKMGTRRADSGYPGYRWEQLRASALSWTCNTFQIQTLALRGGTDWSDDSAGVTRARLKMKKPEANGTETGNATETNDSGSKAPSEE